MTVRKLLLRSSVLAALGGAAMAAIPYIDLIDPAAPPETISVVLSPEPISFPGQAGPNANPARNAARAQPVSEISQSAWGLPCGLSVTATPMPGAMVALDVMDPCRPDARVEIRHMALRLSARTDAMGLLTLDIPAMESPARFVVQLESGAIATAETDLPDLADYARAAIVWTGPPAITLLGGAGQPSQDDPAMTAGIRAETGQFLSRLGDATLAAPYLAHVLTSPIALRNDPSISVEIAVDAATCGQPLAARSLYSQGGGAVQMADISLTLPGCDAMGEFLILQNLFEAPRLRGN